MKRWIECGYWRTMWVGNVNVGCVMYGDKPFASVQRRNSEDSIVKRFSGPWHPSKIDEMVAWVEAVARLEGWI